MQVKVVICISYIAISHSSTCIMYVPLNEMVWIMSSIYIKLYLYKIWNKKQPLNYHLLSHKYALTYIMNEPLNKVIRLQPTHLGSGWLYMQCFI